MKKLIDFNDVLIKKVEKIQFENGLKSFTAAVCCAISNWYDYKYYSKHKERLYKPKELLESGEPEPTPEQLCERAGGRAITDQWGNKVCQFVVVNKFGETKRGVPIDQPKRFEQIAKEMKLIK